ncbi:site-specific DNA-methyltransferase [Sulfurimonas sp.]|uniref:site-specific DNA-methyltransferase n=1 Tax=Sulfurimonas sp. TaxID=2022749 RepID=UPI003D0D0164
MSITEEKLNDNSKITANSKQLEILKKNFPNCFDKDGNFIAHKMEEIVTGNGLELSKESYSLNWLGKSYARLLANENPRTQLKEDKENNQQEDNKNSQNLLIKGDNLEVLKHLQNAYENQIKMIYIDPPYNTGGDGFVYNDDRKFGMEELSQLAGVSLEEAKKILEFTASNSNSHSAWLTFMYPRLYIARELLKEDGVIFISIDDNEASQLKLLCDEVFGEENFIAEFIWQKRSGANDSKNLVSSDHEYIISYSKRQDISLNGTEKTFANYKNPDDDPLGDWTSGDLTCNKTATERPNLYYPITDPETGITYECNKNRVWRTVKSKMEQLIKDKKIIFPKSGNGTPMYKRHKSEVQSLYQPMSSLLGSYLNANSTKELRTVLGEQIFSYPKSTKLLKTLIISASNQDDIILDFFAGSGTTAHAVMEQNKEDGGNRKYIIVQIDELTDKKSEAYNAGYKTIFDITKERITRASKKIKEEVSKDVTKDRSDYDLGFKIFETTPLLENPLDKMDKFDDNTSKLFEPTTLTEDDFNALLTTWKVHDGIKLTDELKEVTFKEYKAYYGDKKVYFVHNGFTTQDLKEFIKKLDDDKSFEPNKLIVFGYTFESKYQREISEALASYTNKKSIEIDMIVRY